MNLRVVTHAFPHVKILITKIVHLARMLRVSEGDILLFTTSNRLKFVVFLATLLSDKCLYIASSEDEISKLLFEGNFGTLVVDKYIDRSDKQVATALTLYEEPLFSNDKNFEFLIGTLAQNKSHLLPAYLALDESSFKDERESLLYNWDYKEKYPSKALSLKVDNETVTYGTDNISHMLNAVDSEFSKEKKVYANFADASFESSFIYMLYFFLKGELTSIGKTSLIRNVLIKSDTTLKHLDFKDNDHFEEKWHDLYKYGVYSNVNTFLSKWKLTKWITRFTFDKILRNTVIFRSKYELILINLSKGLDRIDFLTRARSNVSVIFGTPADGNTLSINRYTDKELKIKDNQYRIMDQGGSIQIQVDKIKQLCLGGERIPRKLRTVPAIQSKRSDDLYHLNGSYCELKGEILTLKADSEDLYFDDEGNIAVDTGTRKRSLMAIPYIKRVDVFKHKGLFVSVVDFDLSFIKERWEDPTLVKIYLHLTGKINELNSNFSGNEKIAKLVVSKKFFDEYDNIRNIITKKGFIGYLSQQPLSLIDQSPKRGDIV